MLKQLVPFLSRYFTCSFYPLPICHRFATVDSMRIIQPQKVKKFEAHAGFVFARSALTPLHKPFYPAYLLSHRSAECGTTEVGLNRATTIQSEKYFFDNRLNSGFCKILQVRAKGGRTHATKCVLLFVVWRVLLRLFR